VKRPWAQLLTLGVPSGEVSARDAWESVHRWIGRFVHALRDALRNESDDLRVKGGGKLEYAWVVEAHKSGHPHVHIAHNLAWLDGEWALGAWKRATRKGIKRIHQAVVRDQSLTSRYLVKYLSKAELSLDVLVLLKSKHLIGSTIKAPKKEPEGWTLRRVSNFAEVESIISGKDSVLSSSGWSVSEKVDGCYAIWEDVDGFARLKESDKEKDLRRKGIDWVTRSEALRQATDWSWRIPDDHPSAIAARQVTGRGVA
jgi:hypothetical protein